MRSFLLFVLLITLCQFAPAQKLSDVLATSKVRTYTAADLSEDGQKAYLGQRDEIAAARGRYFDELITDELLDLESKAVNSTPEKLIATEKAKVPDPTAAQIQAVYDANRSVLEGRQLSEVRKDIIDAIRREPEQKALDAYIKSLQTKHKTTLGKSVNALDLKAADVIVTFGTRPFTARDFDAKFRVQLNDLLHYQYEDFRGDLEISILDALVDEEAKARNTTASSIIAAEVTDKMRTFADGEREELEQALLTKLFAKYDVRILMKEPPIITQSVSIDDDPSRGPISAPVTVIMFSDFQCPACARTHPILKSVLTEFGDKARLVVRDYPLQNIHENAFLAAMAANAANAQGKFFEYIELLYRYQGALDRESLKAYAGQIGLNVKQFEIDLNAERSAVEIRKDISDGELYAVSSTPTIFVNGVKVHRLSPDAFRRAINRALTR
ncbi:MAG: thioredoxin domain-containing protein [Blastocatellia bacterium]|nr:thioredoxin domain-containing protein [Blastocatellia bacterium]